MTEEKIQLEKLSRKQIEKYLERLLAEKHPHSHPFSELHTLLSRLKHSPKKAYSVLEKYIESSNDLWISFHRIAEEFVTDAPSSVYDFLIERAAEARFDFNLMDALTVSKILIKDQKARDLAFRLFTGEKRDKVSIDEIVNQVRKRYENGWLHKEHPIYGRDFHGPDDHLQLITHNLANMKHYSEELVDFLTEKIDSWYPIDIAFALGGLDETKGINEHSLKIFKKVAAKDPHSVQICWRAFTPIDAPEGFYNLLDKWIDLDRDFAIDDLPKWLIHYQPEWIKHLDANGWLKISKPKSNPRDMGNLFYYFFTGKRKNNTSIDEVLAIAGSIIEKRGWYQSMFLNTSYDFLEIVDTPKIWEFVRQEAFAYKLEIRQETIGLFRFAVLMAKSPEARAATYKFFNGKEKIDVSLEEILKITKDKKWQNEALRNELSPYGHFLNYNLQEASYLIPYYFNQNWAKDEIIAVGKNLSHLKEKSNDFYQFIEGLKPDDVASCVRVCNAWSVLPKEKRFEMMNYLRNKGDKELIEDMSEIYVNSDDPKGLLNLRKKLSYFSDLPTEKLVELLSKAKPLFYRLWLLKEEESLDINIDQTADKETNYKNVKAKMDELLERYKLFKESDNAGPVTAYRSFAGLSSEKKLAMVKYIHENQELYKNVLTLHLSEKNNKRFQKWRKQLNFFEDLPDLEGFGIESLVELFAMVGPLYYTLAEINEIEKLFGLKLNPDDDIITNYERFKTRLDELYSQYRDIVDNRTSALPGAYNALDGFSHEKRLEIIHFLSNNPEQIADISLLNASSFAFSEWKSNLISLEGIINVTNIGAEGFVGLLAKSAQLYHTLRDITRDYELFDLRYDSDLSVERNYQIFKQRVDGLFQEYQNFTGEKGEELRNAYNALEGFGHKKRLEVVEYLRQNADKLSSISLLDYGGDNFKRWRQKFAYFEDLPTEIGSLVNSLSRAGELFFALKGIGKEKELLGIDIGTTQDINRSYGKFTARIDSLYQKYQCITGDNRHTLIAAYNALIGYRDSRKLEIVWYLKNNPNKLSDVGNLKDLYEKDKIFSAWSKQLAYFEGLDDEKIISALSRIETLYTILKRDNKQDRVYNLRVKKTKNLSQDYTIFVNKIEQQLYDFINDIFGKEIKRENFRITDEVLTILKAYKGSNKEVVRQLYKKYMEGSSTFSLDEIAKISSIQILPSTEPLIITLLSNYEQNIAVPKIFPLGKEYLRQAVHGMKEKRTPTEMTELLIYGLISRDPNRIRLAADKFDLELLQKARACVNPIETYTNIHREFELLKTGNELSAKRILDYLYNKYRNIEVVTDLVEGVQGLFFGQERFDYMACRMQDSNIFDTIGSQRLMCCTFQPASNSASLFYLIDPNIGLLHLVPIMNRLRLDPIGVAIMADCYDRNKKKVLLVDSVEGGMQIDRLRESAWKNVMYNGIISVAKDIHANTTAFNVNTAGVKPKKFNNYVRRVTGLEPSPIYLEKVGGTEIAKQYKISSYGLESFKSAELKGEVNCILVNR